MSFLLRTGSLAILLGWLIVVPTVQAQKTPNRRPRQSAIGPGGDIRQESLAEALFGGIFAIFKGIAGLFPSSGFTFESPNLQSPLPPAGWPEAQRQAEMERALNRARGKPPLTEVLAADPHNALLRHLIREQGRGRQGPGIPLSEDLLRRINVMLEGSCGNVGLLRAGGEPLSWPAAFQGPKLAAPREAFERLLLQAAQQARSNGQISYPVYEGLLAAQARLEQALDRSVNALTPTEFIQGRRFLTQLNEAVKALSNPRAGQFFDPKCSARGKTVADLVQNMARQGLKFAPAATGDGPAYQELLAALAAWDAGLRQGTGPVATAR